MRFLRPRSLLEKMDEIDVYILILIHALIWNSTPRRATRSLTRHWAARVSAPGVSLPANTPAPRPPISAALPVAPPPFSSSLASPPLPPPLGRCWFPPAGGDH
eukprot:GHVU01232280.1.p3 GENE.GHVU01232280.1~~GHVU01232280.1.p3  ORF type:complete len:103 (-),score=7.28 GHVU01232280.1:1449-1757(-)